MTSGNDTGQGTGSATTKIDDERDETQVREGTVPGAESSDTAAEPAPTDSPVEDAPTDSEAAQERREAPATGSAVADTGAEQAAGTPPARTPAASSDTGAAAPAASDEGTKPIPGGFWRSAYEAGAEAPSSRYTSGAAAATNGTPAAAGAPEGAPAGPAQEVPAGAPAGPSAGTPVGAPGGATAGSVSEPERDEIDETTKPRVVSRESIPAASANEARRQEPADPASTGQGPATAAPTPDGTPRPGEDPADPADPAAAVKQGAVKAAQAALAAARNAAKKVSSAMPETPATSATSAAESRPTSSTPPEMHYAAGAVRGSASVPVEETIPVGQGAQPESDTAPGPAPSVTPRPSAGPRRVRLAISRIDPWSVMKLAFLLSVAIAIMTVVATVVFWSVIDSLGVFDKVQTFVTEAIGEETNFNVMQYVEFERVVSLSTLVAICNVVLLTALATIMTFLYNITAALVGGVHMTLTDD